MTKTLLQLLSSFENQTVAADGKTLVSVDDAGSVFVTSLEFDSRKVKKDSLYFALPGTHVNGNDFIPQAIEKGASAIVFQGEFSKELSIKIAKAVAKRHLEDAIDGEKIEKGIKVAFIKVKDARFSMAPLSDCFYDYPSKKLAVIGVTGTEGKSSTVSFIWQLLRLCGKKAGFISTVEYSFGGEALANPEHQTTPEAPVINCYLKKMVENGCEYAVVESSSHGLSKKTNRLGSILFDCAVFMNVTLEHLEFHKNFETYRDDKANLFRALDLHDHIKFICGKKKKICSVGIVNLEDPSFEYFMKATEKPVIGYTTYGMAGKAAAEKEGGTVSLPEIPENMHFLKAMNISSARLGLDFSLETDSLNAVIAFDDAVLSQNHSHFQVQTKISGAFNAYNIMAAVAAVSSVTELSYDEVVSKVPELLPVKGRMTVVEMGQPFEVIIDYAHTPSSFETIFPPVRKRCSGKMFCVFGSGGERDLTKRPLQGQIAAKFCDCVVLADEDPRGEDPVELLRMIANGALAEGKKEGEDLFIIHDRKKAIRFVLAKAQKGDIVLFLGKSHENSIIYKDFVMPYDEIKEVKDALSEIGYCEH